MNKIFSVRVLSVHFLWSFVGLFAPLIVAIYSIPVLINGIGGERFGLLTLIWMLVGYFGLVDMGLSRALTKMVAERLGGNDYGNLSSLIWTAFVLLAVLSCFGAVVVSLGASYLVERVLVVPLYLHPEAIVSFKILALGLPIVVLSSALNGLLEAKLCFKIIASIRIPLGFLTYISPVMAMQCSTSLVYATMSLLISRILIFIAYYFVTSRIFKEVRSIGRINREHLLELFKFGGWLTMSNIVGPVMTYLDRFFVGSMVDLSAVSCYATSCEVLSKMQILPQAAMSVFFPVLSTVNNDEGQDKSLLFKKHFYLLLILMFPIVFFCFLFSNELLRWWIGNDFALMATSVVRILSVGWMINFLAHPAFTVLQAGGRTDLIAKVHLIEFVPYLGLLFALINMYGIVGAAFAWALRVVVDALILNFIVFHVFKQLRRNVCGVLIAIIFVILIFTFIEIAAR